MAILIYVCIAKIRYNTIQIETKFRNVLTVLIVYNFKLIPRNFQFDKAINLSKLIFCTNKFFTTPSIMIIYTFTQLFHLIVFDCFCRNHEVKPILIIIMIYDQLIS